VIDAVAQWLRQHQFLGWAAPIGVGAFALSVAAGLAVVVWLPADYFVRAPSAHGFWHSHRVWRVILLAAKNLVGGLTFIVGAVMAIPLVPGPGLLLMLVGIGLVDFPGRRALERRLVRMPRVLSSVNRLRARFGRPPLATE
jgi:hypothetical protein